MLDKPLESLQEEDIQRLITDAVEEGKTIDFKQTLPQFNDDGKREFLADVSSFANTIGGHLVFGLKEVDGVAREICGIEDAAWDDTILALDGSIRTAIAPRIIYHFHTIRLADSKRVLVIKIERSWNAPHRVTFKGHDKFYARGANGKYPLDVDQLRIAFATSSGIEDRIREFRFERIARIAQEQTPVPMKSGGKILLHLIPASAMTPFAENRIAWTTTPDPRDLQPPSTGSWSHRRNYEGYLTYAGGKSGPSRSYIQLFHSGIMETALSDIAMDRSGRGRKSLYCTVYEHELIQNLSHLLKFQNNIGIEPPLYLFITLIGCKDVNIFIANAYDDDEDYFPVDRDVLELPSTTLDLFDIDPAKTLQPVFDVVWQTCGFERSPNFDMNGVWIRR